MNGSGVPLNTRRLDYVKQGWDPETGVPLPGTIRALEIEEDANAVASPA